MYTHHTFRLWVNMNRSFKYVTFFPEYYTHMTLFNAGATFTPAEFLFHFIAKAQFRRFFFFLLGLSKAAVGHILFRRDVTFDVGM